MFLSGKETIFFVLTFLVILVALYMGSRMRPKIVSLLIISLLGASLLLAVYKLGKIPKCQADGFHFEVTPPKICEGGPYLWSSAPQEVQDYCNKLFSTPEGQLEYAQYNCCGGLYNGRPLSFEYSPESNSKWENERCAPPHDLSGPQVL
jgi:hypothetical protein